MADLYFSDAVADEMEVAAVSAAIGDVSVVVHESGRLVRAGTRKRRDHRHLLLPALHALSTAKGWITPGGLNHVCELLQVSPADAYGVATFYEMFRFEEPDREGDLTHVCVDSACRMAGSEELADSIEAEGGRVHRSPCLGQCERAPASFVQGVGRPDPVPTSEAPIRLPQAGDPSLRLLRRIGPVDPTSLESYRDNGGYDAMAKAVALGPESVCQTVSDSGLSGRGGAAFPTGVKWRAVAAERNRPKHVVANCDESEPGTFKDRLVMENDPFAVIEALTIAGFATGAEHGWIYVRGEYPLATSRLRGAIEQARAAGLLGENAAGSGHRFDIQLRRGAGAYICGEETALFASIEGFRGEPRSKPPFPTTHGLFGEPTAINNPETLLNVLEILSAGVDEYRSRGTQKSPGTKLLCVSGRVAQPGVYEVDFGIPLGDALELAGGVRGHGELSAVLLGGASGSFVGPDALDMPLSLEGARERGCSLGSGALTVFTADVDLLDIAVRISEFFRSESCGQCVPCRIGTVRQNETMVQLQQGGTLTPERRQLGADISEVMTDASICGLGHTATSAINSALALGLIPGMEKS